MNLDDVGEILLVADVSKLLRVPESWVYGETCSTGKRGLPFRRVGGKLRFIRSEIFEWLNSQPGFRMRGSGERQNLF